MEPGPVRNGAVCDRILRPGDRVGASHGAGRRRSLATLPTTSKDLKPVRAALVLACLLLLPGCRAFGPTAPSHLIVWAWERPEDLRFAGPGTEVAIQTG